MLIFFEQTTPHISGNQQFRMVVTTHMIHQMIRESQKKKEDEKKLQRDLDSATLQHFIKNAEKSESKSEKIIS